MTGIIFGLPNVLGLLVVAVVFDIISVASSKFLVNQGKLRELKKQVAELNKKSKGQTPEESKETMKEALSLQNQQMKMTMKPSMVTLLVAVPVFSWLVSAFQGPVALLPFSLPYFGADFGWLMWYLVLNITFSFFFKKVLGVE